jgi:hypothetical protein
MSTSKAMLKNLQLLSESRGSIVCLLAILLTCAILFVVVLPFPAADFEHVTFALPVLVFCLVIRLQINLDRVPLENAFSVSEPFLAATFGRAPPTHN